MDVCDCCGRDSIEKEIKGLSTEDLQLLLITIDERLYSLQKIRAEITARLHVWKFNGNAWVKETPKKE